MSDKSDYNKPRINLLNFLPQIFRDSNEPIVGNVFDRFLSKTELTTSSGSLRKSIPADIVSINLQLTPLDERDVTRQAWQLQPLLYTKIASIEHIASWEDILNRSKRLGIDPERFANWGKTTVFNFAPPIDFDKVANYQNYYWEDTFNPNSIPQYITIKNPATIFQSEVNALEKYYDQQVAAGVSQEILDDILANITIAQIMTQCSVNGNGGWGLPNWDDNGGWKELVLITGLQTFTLPLSFVSTYVVKVNGNVVSPGTYVISGVNNELLTITVEDEDILEVVGIPWFYSVYPGLGPPVPIPTLTDPHAWYDLGTGLLKKWNQTLLEWVALNPQPTALYGWGDGTLCQIITNQWIQENKWVYKDDVSDFAIAKQAKIPIIEYNTYIELNEWTFINFRWKYRKDTSIPWEISEEEPSIDELATRYKIRNSAITGQEPWQDGYFRILGNYTSTFINGFRFSIDDWHTGSSSKWTVQACSFDGTDTLIYTLEPIDANIVTGNYVVPFIITSKGDSWQGFFNQWMLYQQDDPIPIGNLVLNQLQPTKKENFSIGTAPVSGTNPYNEHNATIFSGHFKWTINPLPSEILYYDGACVTITTLGTLPEPFTNGTQYFIVKIDNSNFGLAQTVGGSPIVLTTIGLGPFQIRPLEFLLANNTTPYQSGQLRVYVNGIRQYGNYTVGSKGSIGAITYTVHKYDPVNAIRFNFLRGSPPKVGDVIHIETFVSLSDDIGRELVYVRTTENDTFTPVVLPLVRYFKQEQDKTESNQYPLFNLYDINGSHSNTVSKIFSFVEDSTALVNPQVGKRIKVTNQRKEFYFYNDLFNSDDNTLWCYRDLQTISNDNPDGLQTIWKKGLNDEQYIPKYINKYRFADGETYTDENGDTQTAIVPAGEGTWGVPDTLFFNPEHEVRNVIKFSEIYPHFKSVIMAQMMPVEFSFIEHNGFHLLSTVNYGVGGTIKEYNNSFDTFLSAMFQDVANPISVTTFAHTAYETLIDFVKRYYLSNNVDQFTSSTTSLSNMIDQLLNKIILTIKLNDLYDLVYGDSSAYDGINGIKNWVSTLPMFGLWYKIQPHILKDDTLLIHKLVHHDGHKSDINISAIDKKQLIDTILVESDGVQQSSAPLYTTVSNGLYWYNPLTKILYRFIVAAFQLSTPSPLSNYPIDSLWYNNGTGILYIRDIGGWSAISGIVGDIVDAWVEIDPVDILGSVLLGIEQKLFDISPTRTSLVFDYTTLVPEQLVYTDYLRDAFFDYIRYHKLDPSATDYNPTDAFTWNYKSVSSANVVYPTAETAISQPWGARYTTIYQKIFGTSYPHLEPWCLQGYTSKPSWWDQQYLNTTGTRRWIYDFNTNIGMWGNIKAGIIPVGKVLPSGATSTGSVGQVTQYFYVPVNIDNNILDGYNPDDLLPPYLTSITNNLLPDSVLVRQFSYIPAGTVTNEYTFGDIGPTEFRWRTSSSYIYDQLKIAFRMQPVKLLHQAFGIDYVAVAGLDIEKVHKKVYSHRDIMFHGSQDTLTTSVYFKGFNQWYTNFMRYHNYDIHSSDFSMKWQTWKPLLSYQADSFIDAKSLAMYTSSYNFTKEDYRVLVKKTEGSESFDLDSLLVTVSSIGTYTIAVNSKVPIGDGADWVFKVDIPAAYNKNLKYYRSQKYSITNVNTSTNVFTIAGTLPWTTGEIVRLKSSVNVIPAPLSQTQDYYVIVLSPTTFKLAESASNAESTLAIDITSIGGGSLLVGAINSVFQALDGQRTTEMWRTYKLDKPAGLITVDSPLFIVGVQNVIDFINGYAEVLREQGFVFNDFSVSEQDPATGRLVSWQVEIERLINQIYSGLGTTVAILNTEDTSSLNTQFHEVNPFRNNIWFEPDRGIVADIFRGVYSDIKTVPAIYDQVGNYLTSKQCKIYRQDKLTRISLDEINIATNPFVPYLNKHIGGMKLYTNTYEHVIIFNLKTLDTNLIYDSFLGLQTPVIFLEFSKNIASTGRPNIGGFFLGDQLLYENYETLADNVRLYYDTYQVNETSNHLDYARSLLGYQDPSYLSDLGNVGSKSRFVFWKGMIQHKGTTTAIDAIINAKALTAATVDEFWAYRVGQFGDAKRRVFSEMKVFRTDLVKNQLKFQFIATDSEVPDIHFTPISINDTSRWIDQPDQLRDTTDVKLPFFSFECLVEPTNTHILTPDVGGSTRYLKLDRPADVVVIAFDSNRTSDIKTIQYITYQDTTLFNTSLFSPSVVNFYVVGSDNIRVFLDGVVQKSGVDYIEVGASSIVFTSTIPAGKTIIIKKKLGILPVSYFSQDNSRLFRFPSNFNPLLYTFQAYTINPSPAHNNPAYMVDDASKTILYTLDMWDPARGRHFYLATPVIDLYSNTDPARYNVNRDPRLETKTEFWNSYNEGKVWLDTSKLHYIPYYDIRVFGSIEDRLANWGKLADYGQINLWQWTKSSITPDKWNNKVLLEANDITIPQDKKLSGTPLKHVYIRTRTTLTSDWSNWKLQQPPRYQEFYRSLLAGQRCNITDFTVSPAEPIDVYINGKFASRLTLDIVTGHVGFTIPANINVNISDTIRAVQVIFVPSEEDISLQDTTNSLIEYIIDYPYVGITKYNDRNEPVDTDFYFWVTGKINKVRDTGLSLLEAAELLETPNSPHLVVQGVIAGNRTTDVVPDTFFSYNQLIVNRVGIDKILSDGRIKIRFVDDHTLRDQYRPNLNRIYHEWTMFREKQEHQIPRELWDKVTEAFVGFSLSDHTIIVPTINRVIFDRTYGTDTQYGIDEGQAFCDKIIGLETIQREIASSQFNLYPVDREWFLNNYSFDTNNNIISAMNFIYLNFPPAEVNRIFFSLLNDALTLKKVYKNLMKTSYIALSGEQQLPVPGG